MEAHMKSKGLVGTIAMTLVAALAIPVQLAGQEQLEGKGHHRYKLIDLGTFGGPASYFANGFDGILNNHGTSAGWADTSTPDPYPGFCVNLDCFVSHAFAWRNGSKTDLGVLPGGSSSYALWISQNGLITGNSQNGEVDPLIPGLPEIRAVIWRDGQIIDLGTLEGGHESVASAVNNRGQVVGAFNNIISDPFSLVGNGYQVRAFLWHDGSMEDLGTLGGPDAFALLINDRGQITGQSYTSSVPGPVTGLPPLDPFLWENGEIIDLGTLGGTSGIPTAFNNRGEIVGQSNLAGDLIFHPFLWTRRGGMKDLGTLGGNTGLPNWVNGAGEVVGKADLSGPSPQNHDAVLWKNDEITDLGVLPGDSCSNAYYVNSKGQIVGTSEDRAHCLALVGEHAFLWEDGGPIVDLNTLIPPNSSLRLTYAVAINDRGEIAGFGVPPGVLPDEYETKGHAYVLIPCDEDHPELEGCDDSLFAQAPAVAGAAADQTSGLSNQAPTAQNLPTKNRKTFLPVGANPLTRRFGRPWLP
jgi:probable HAF family extracellular repeat protein